MQLVTIRPARVGSPTDLAQVWNWNIGLSDAILCVDSLPLDVSDQNGSKVIYTRYSDITSISEIERIAYYLRNVVNAKSPEIQLYCTGSVFSEYDTLTPIQRVRILTDFLTYLKSMLINDFGLSLLEIRTSGLMGAENYWAKAAVASKLHCSIALPGTPVYPVYTISTSGTEIGFKTVAEYAKYAGF